MRLAGLLLILITFTVWSLTIVFAHGPLGFLEMAYREPWGMQVFLDLAIAVSVASYWLRSDALKNNLPWKPYVFTVPLFGSISVLAYLVHRELSRRATSSSSANST